MGLTKQYLRYVPSGTFNVIASPDCNSAHVTLNGISGRYVAVGACEHVIIWDMRLGEKAQVIPGENVLVSQIAASPTGNHMAVGYVDGNINVFELINNEIVCVFAGHKSAVTCLQYDEQGHRIISGSKDTEVILWDVVSETGKARFSGHKGVVTSVLFINGRNCIISSSKDTFIKFWDIETKHCFKTLGGHQMEVWSAVLLKEERYLVTGSMDQELRVWKLNWTDKVKEEDKITQQLEIVKLEDADNTEDTSVLQCHQVGSLYRGGKGRVVGLVTDPGQSVLACYGNDSLLELFEFCSDEEAKVRMNKRIKKQRSKLNKKKESGEVDPEAVDVSEILELSDEVRRPSSVKLAAKIKSACLLLGTTGELRVGVTLATNTVELHSLNIAEGNEVKCLKQITQPGHQREPRCVAISSDNLAILSASADSIKIWNRSSQACLHTLAADARPARATFLPGDRHALVACADGRLLLLDAPAARLLEAVPAHSAAVTALALAPDLRPARAGGVRGRPPAAAGRARRAPARGRARAQRRRHRARTRARPRTTRLIIIYYTTLATGTRWWRARTAACCCWTRPPRACSRPCPRTAPPSPRSHSRPTSYDTSHYYILYYTSDRHALVACADGRLLLLDAPAARLLEAVPAHSAAVTALALAPDLRGCYTGGADKTVKFWSFELIPDTTSESKAKVLSLLHTRTLQLEEAVSAARVSPDSRFVAVALLDSTVRLFFVDTFKFYLSLYGHKLPVHCLDFSYDSTIIATGSADRNVKIWGVDFGDCHKSIFAHNDSVTALQFVPGTHYFFTASRDGRIKQWDADSYDNIITLNGHAGGCWSLAVGPGGLHAASCGADGALRLLARSDEPLVLGDQDDEEEGLATGERHAPVPSMPGLTMPTKKTIGAEKAADSLVECMSVCAEFRAAGPGAPPPALMAAYGCNTPEDFVLETVRRIRSSELEEALLLLPAGTADELVRVLPALLERRAHAELLVRLALFLLRVHRAPQALRKQLIQIQAKAALRLAELRDMVGFNLHALKWLQRDVEAEQGEQLFRDATRQQRDKRSRGRRALKRPIVSVT